MRPFVLAMAWRESRASLRRMALLLASIGVGVAALVAISSFTDSLQESVREQARALLGADLVLGSANRFSPPAERELQKIVGEAPRAEVSRLVRFAAMAYVPRTAGTRLVQVTAAEGGYPFYGHIETSPPGLWERLPEPGGVLVDPGLLSALDAKVGDTLALGDARLVIRGVVTSMPGDVAVRSALGPRVFMSARDLDATSLLGFGARARYEAYLELPAAADPQRLALRHRPVLAAERVSLRTVSEDEESLNETLGRLGRYLALVALVALLLGGLGVASAVHVFIKRKIETVAVLRCLGATGRGVLAVYLVQASVLGLIGAALGVAAGLAVQAVLPLTMAGLLPVEVRFSPSWPAVAAGLAVGLWVAAAFSLIPLLSIRHVSPLVVLRRAYETEGRARRDPVQMLAVAGLAASVVILAVLEAPTRRTGAGFAFGIGLALAALWAAGLALTWALRRFFPARWPYLWRQGVANLYRPANQTVMVVLALGFGAFLLDTLFLVQHNLLRDLRVDAGGDRPNLVLFDIQPDQRAGVEAALRRAGLPVRESAPIVPMRIQSVKGQSAGAFLATSAVPRSRRGRRGEPNPWTLRREYRSTYRDALTSSEKTAAGGPWPPAGWRGAAGPVPISIEREVATELGVGVGDEIVWDVQGRAITTRVFHLREVSWARFEPNFFVVFPSGPLDTAPQSLVTLSRADDPRVRADVQRRIVEAFPNVTALDLAQVQQALDRIVSRVALAIRFMALFSLATGAVVLLGAVATSRYQRLREAVLLKTLGATRGQLLRIAFTEYVCLGGLASLTALLLATVAAWALVRFVFESRFSLPATSLTLTALAVVTLTVLVGLWTSAEMVRKPPLEVLRTE
ncbi:MAG: permease [Acidobacteria bacterium]|nr:MAG: permease [Acidobacteriota bacterium]